MPITGHTQKRLIFQPINPTRYSRNASLPADYPVLVVRVSSVTYRLEACVDADSCDYFALSGPDGFRLDL